MRWKDSVRIGLIILLLLTPLTLARAEDLGYDIVRALSCLGDDIIEAARIRARAIHWGLILAGGAIGAGIYLGLRSRKHRK